MKKLTFLSGNALKIIACILMAIDHIGYILFPYNDLFRIIGRLAYPIFAFMIAEGVKHTKNKLRYFLTMLGFGALFQIVMYIYAKDTFMGIFITFSLAIPACYALQFFKKSILDTTSKPKIKVLSGVILVLSVGAIYLINQFVDIDYGFFGCILPLIITLFHFSNNSRPNSPSIVYEKIKVLDNHYLSVLMLALGLIGVWLMGVPISIKPLQPFSFLSIPLLLLYNGKRGKYKMKYFFYIFYPVHLLIIYGISYFI